MSRRILAAMLAIGAASGFAWGFTSLACHQHERQRALERHVAEVCLEAASARK